MKKYIKKIYLLKLLVVTLISFLFFVFKIGDFFALENSFSILDVSVQSKSESAEISYVNFKGNKIKTDATFHKLGDYITYKIKIKNNEDVSYIIKSVNNKNQNEYIAYEYDKYENVKIGGKEEKEFLFTAKYVKKLNDISKRNQVFSDEFVFSLEDEKGETTEKSVEINNADNPNTGDDVNIYIALFVISFLAVVLFIFFFKKTKTKKKSCKNNNRVKFFSIFLILSFGLFMFASKAVDPKTFKITFDNNISLKDRLIVTYNIDGNSGELFVNYGETLNLDTPVKSGYKFKNWVLSDGSIFDVSKQITDDVNITASFIPSKKAKFANGPIVNIKMKQLAGDEGVNKNSDDFNIKKIKKANDIPNEYKIDDNLVSTNESEYKIYMYFSDGTIYYYSEADELYLNQNSSYMFNHLKNLKELDTEAFKTDEVNNMELMFYECRNLKSLDLNNFDTKNVEKMNSLFSSCESIEKLNLSKFDTKNVADMSSMFNKCYMVNEINLSSFNTENVLNMNRMFSSCEHMESVDLSSFNTRSVKNMEKMFDNMYNVKTISVSENFSAESVQKMDFMFRNCYNLESLNLSGFNASVVETTEQMFYRCYNLKSLNFGEFNSPRLTNTASMFSECKNIKSLTWGSFNTSAVTNMRYMFNECLLLETVDLSSFNTENVRDMNHMFSSCEKLKILDLSGFDTRNATNMEKMFHNCFDLVTIYSSDKFTIENVDNGENMFTNDFNLIGGRGTVYNGVKVSYVYAHIDGGELNPGYFSGKEM